MTDDLFSLFDDDNKGPEGTLPRVVMISPEQRAAIKAAFLTLAVVDARTQFEVVYELTAQRISSPSQLEARYAHMLIEKLAGRVRDRAIERTGNSWADRDEDTWIDKL